LTLNNETCWKLVVVGDSEEQLELLERIVVHKGIPFANYWVLIMERIVLPLIKF
jgi:hypothetical protein